MNPKFVYLKGPYRQFRGYEFVNGKAVTIMDRATVEALRHSNDFKELKDETQEAEAASEVLTEI